MAATIIRNQNEFRHLSIFQYQFCIPPFQQELDFQEASEEEEEEDEEEEEEFEPEESTRDAVLPFMDIKILDPSSRLCEPALQLLRFADLISSDIQRYFGQKSKEDPDFCNIYEDRFSAGKSGRELYYADLLQIAHLGDQDEGDQYLPLTPPKDTDYQILKSICDRDGINKLGPLAELFEYGLYKYFMQRPLERKMDAKQKLSKKYAHVVPMHKRKLPPSFWKEPALNSSSVLHANTPDFSDLLANWTSEAGHELHISVNSDVSREMSRNSLETEHYYTG